MRTYRPSTQPVIAQPVIAQPVIAQPVIAQPTIQPIIDKDTKLVSLEEASAALLREKGLKLSVKVIRVYCSTGKWKRGIHWVKPSRSYLINLDAVYDWVARSSA